jgi:hypothetical protein
LSRRDDLGPFGQMLGAEQLSVNRAGEQILAGVGTEKRGEDGKGAAGVEAGDRLLAVGCGLWAMGSGISIWKL